MKTKKSKEPIKSMKELQGIARYAFLGKEFVNTDLAPTCPPEMRVVEHLRMGKVNISKLELYLSEEQKKFSVKGGIYRRKLLLKNKKTINATVLDRLMLDQSLIPESWAKNEEGRVQVISFFGTIYAHQNGALYVRIMYPSIQEKKWNFGKCCINNDYWDSNNPIVIIAD